MSQEVRPSEASDTSRQWWPWLLAGALLGIAFAGSLGAAIGIVAEALIVWLVNRLPANKVRTNVGALLLIGCGFLAGSGSALVLANFVKLKDEMLIWDFLERGDDVVGVSTWALIGGTVGGLIATIDRLFMWVVDPYGAEPPTEPIDVPDQDSDPAE